jgi:hypothetical protein
MLLLPLFFVVLLLFVLALLLYVCFDASWVNFHISNTCLVSSLTFAHYGMFGLA